MYIEQATKRLLQQIGLGAIFKSISVVLSFFFIGLLIKEIGQEKYGVWVTIFAMMTWISYLDFGMNSSIHTLVAGMSTKTDLKKLKNTILSGYLVLFIIALCIIILVTFSLQQPKTILLIQRFWGFDISAKMIILALNLASIILFFNLITGIVGALQRSSLTHLAAAVGMSINLITIYYFNKLSLTSLEYVIITYCVSVIIGLVIITAIALKETNFVNDITAFVFQPSVFLKARSFFLINFSVIFLFTTDRFLISILLGPKVVTEYDLIYRLAGIILLIHSLINMPTWGPYAQKWAQNDLVWIKKKLKYQKIAGIILIFTTMCILIYASELINIWTGLEIEFTILQRTLVCTLIAVNVFNNIFATFINATGLLKLQTITAIFAATINIPLSIFIVKYYSFNYEGVILGSVIALSIPGIFLYFQSKKLLSERKLQ